MGIFEGTVVDPPTNHPRQGFKPGGMNMKYFPVIPRPVVKSSQDGTITRRTVVAHGTAEIGDASRMVEQANPFTWLYRRDIAVSKDIADVPMQRRLRFSSFPERMQVAGTQKGDKGYVPIAGGTIVGALGAGWNGG